MIDAYPCVVAGRRWGAQTPSSPADARERLVDATEICLDRIGVAKATVDDVATQAQVSRATVYRYFRNRDELVLAVMLRELERSYDRSLHEFAATATDATTAAEAIVEAAAYLLATIRGNAKLQLFLGPGFSTATATVQGASEALFASVGADLRPELLAAQERGVLRSDVTVDDLAEWIVRTIISLLTVPGPRPRTPADDRRLLADFLVPALVAAVPERRPDASA